MNNIDYGVDEYYKFIQDKDDKDYLIRINCNEKNNIGDHFNIISSLIEKEKEEQIKEEYYGICNIILYDYINFPNYIHMENIENITKFIIKKFYENKLEIEYKFENKKIKIFGEKFIKNNKKNCSLIINGEVLELINNIEYEGIYKNSRDFNKNEKILVNLIIKYDNLEFDMSYMFYGITSLVSLSETSLSESIDIFDMNHMFYGCKSLKS